MTGDEIRKAFLQFFEGKGHTVIPSSSLVPQDDPTLLLTSAGMVQVKPYFLGLAVPPNPRLASCQKCFRTTDIESVGDAKHLTFFEMLGNFSVGDYFKKEAIDWAWEFVIQWLKLPPDRLWITVFLDDDEASTYWQETGVSVERIVRLGEEDNFWGPAGDSGPCGPCSEILYDFGEEFGCGKPDCGPACGCDRFTEIWNLVFTQYDQDTEGKRAPLPKPNIDTGMGLERVAAVMQGKTSVYETDLFAPIVARIEALSGKKYGQDETVDRAMRIVAEHGRAVTFLIADGVVPSNEGRGYVLRRVLRRASLFGRKLGLEEPFLTEAAKTVIAEMRDEYPELARNQDFILRLIGLEEERFGQTLTGGLNLLEGIILPFRRAMRSQFAEIAHSLSGAIDEKLKLPTVELPQLRLPAVEFPQIKLPAVELPQLRLPAVEFPQIKLPTVELPQLRLPAVDSSLRQVMTQQYAGMLNEIDNTLIQLEEALATQLDDAMRDMVQSNIMKIQNSITEISSGEAFHLYDTYGFPKESTAEIATENGFSVDLEGFEVEMERQRERARAAQKPRVEPFVITEKGGYTPRFVGYERLKCQAHIWHLLLDGKPVKNASEGQEVSVYLDDTPFYAEMGGQVGDTGEIRGPHGTVRVEDTVRSGDGTTVHRGKVVDGTISDHVGVTAIVDEERRLDIARNHTATHLLQAALRMVLGEHVRQSGSLVAPDRFRFDFTHLESLTKAQLLEVQHIVNDKIRQNLAVVARHVSYDEAISKGAIALFGEKYGDTVRMVETGDPPFSTELCGGTHVSSTGEIGLLHITAESSIGSGMRRIEAVTGREAERFIEQRLSTLEMVAQELDASPDTVQSKLSATLAELDRERKQALTLRRELNRIKGRSLLEQRKVVQGISVVSGCVDLATPESLREVGDQLKAELQSGTVVLGTIYNNRPNFVVMGTPDLVAEGFHAGQVVNEIAKLTGGGGGGTAALGQGSGKDKAKLDEALGQVPKIIALHYDKDTGTWRKNID